MSGRHPGAVDDAAVAGLAFAVYLATLAPSVTTGDSGELIAASATLSIAHPTGYPLYLLLGRAFIAAFGFLSPALAMNLFSAVSAAGACAAVRRVAQRVTGDRLAAAASALLLAFSLSFWSQATTARVYALGALLLALVLLELAGLWQGRGGSLARAWLWLGLGMANHTVMLVAAPLVAWATLRSPLPWRRRLEAAYLGFACLGLYLYLPIAAAYAPAQRWGDPSSARGLLDYLLRRDYWQAAYVAGPGDFFRVVAHYLGRIPAEFTWPGTAVLWAGLAAGWRQRSALPAVGLYLFAANLALMAWHGSRHDIFFWPRYMIPGWLGLTLVASLGFRALHGLPAPLWLRRGAICAVPAAALGLHWASNDRSADRYAHDFAAEILRALEPDAQLFARDDNVLFPLSYLQLAAGLRPDVSLRSPPPQQLDWQELDPERPTYFTYDVQPGRPELALAPSGLAFRLVRRDAGFQAPPWDAAALAAFEAVREPGRHRYLDRLLISQYYLMKALSLETSDPDAALEAIRSSRAITPDGDVAQLNAGLFLERNLRFEEALECFESALRIDPGLQLARERRAQLRALRDRLSGAASAEARALELTRILVPLGRPDLAARALRDALREAPDDPALRRELERAEAALASPGAQRR